MRCFWTAFANTLATEMNKLNGGGAPGSKDNLFETSDGSNTFTASNIKISDDWMDGTVQIKNTNGGGSTANDNILKMKDLLSTKKDLEFRAPDGKLLYTGTMPGSYTNIQNMQGVQKKSTESMLANRVSVMNDIWNNRESISGVSLDEEVANLMRYQQSYNAAARVMTAMDEALDVLINKMGVVGR